MPELEHLLDPTGIADHAADTTLAPRPATLRGLTIGLLDNTKPNAANLLRHVATELTTATAPARCANTPKTTSAPP